MEYSVGEVAALFGLTTQGVRYLEKQGLIQSVRKEGSGYRVFSRGEVARLKEIRMMQSLGFSTEQLARNMPRERILPSLDEQLEAIARKRTELERMEAGLRHQQALVRWFLEAPDHLRLERRPRMLFFPRSQRETRSPWDDQCEAAWTMNMPPVTLCARFFRADGTPEEGDSRFGSSISMEQARELQLPVPHNAIELEECLCIHGMTSSPPMGDTPDIDRFLAYARKNSLALCAPVYINRIVAYQDKEGESGAIHEVWFPVRKTSD